MSKKVTIPVKDFSNFINTDTYQHIGLAFRYRLVNKLDPTIISEWSAVNNLKFLDPTLGWSYTLGPTLSTVLGYQSPNGLTRYVSGSSNVGALGQGFYSWDSNGDALEPMLPSQIDIQASQTNDAASSPLGDAFLLSWRDTEFIKSFDIFMSWQSFALLSNQMTATLSAPSAFPYTGTLTFTGTGSVNAIATLKSRFDYDVSRGAITYLWAGKGTTTPGNFFAVSSYNNTTGVFTVTSPSTWTAAGTIRNVSFLNNWSNLEYVATSDTNSYSFGRKFISNKMTATITAGSNTIITSENVEDAGIVPGMKLFVSNGDGEFGVGATVSKINYQSNTLTVTSGQNSTTAVSHLSGGYVEFYGDAKTSVTLTADTGITQKGYWLTPYYVQAVLCAASGKKEPIDENLLLSISEVQSVWFGVYGTISSASASAPFTATLTSMNLPFPSQSSNKGQRMFATNSAGSFGSGKVVAAKYNSNIAMDLSSTALLTNGVVTNIRF